MLPKFLLVSITVLAARVNSFMAPSPNRMTKHTTLLQLAKRSDLISKEFQLEELEDKEECETELWLNEDGSVTLGATNGPPVKDYVGDWHLLETAGEADRPFRLRLTREYESNTSGTNNLGDVKYSIKREFWGNIDHAGESLTITGKTHGNFNPDSGNAYIDEASLLESEVGYFAMIDAVASDGVEGERRSS